MGVKQFASNLVAAAVYNKGTERIPNDMEIEVATKGASQNGQHKLEDALATLVQTQAAFVQTQAAFAGRLAENDQRHAENELRLVEYERQRLVYERETREEIATLTTQMKEVVRILTEHSRQLERLTDAVRDRIGFKGQRISRIAFENPH